MYAQTQHLDKVDKQVLPQKQQHVRRLRNTQLKAFIDRNQPRLQKAIRRTRLRLKQNNHNILEYVTVKQKKRDVAKPPQQRPQVNPREFFTTAITNYFCLSAKDDLHPP